MNKQEESLKEEDFIELEEKGAVGDVCTCFFDARGEAVSSSFAKRRISITLEELKKILAQAKKR